MTNPVLVLFTFVYPVFLILIFGYLFSNNYTENIVSSYDFYGVTMMFYIVIVSATITPSVFMEERIKQANLRIAYTPVSRIQLYISKLLSTYMILFIAFTAEMLILNFLNIVNYGQARFLYVYGLYMALLLFSVTLGGAVCVIIRNQDLTNKIIGVIVNTLAVVSGIFFPIASLGKLADQISDLVPIKWALNLIFQIIYDGTIQNYGIIILILLLFSIFFGIIIHYRYRPEDYV